MACGFDFEEVYGEIGKNFIEVHHVKPLYSKDEEVEVDPKTDLICLCPNCHRMVHRYKDKVLSLSELKEILK
jgi:5-methylcytosine-specific restriction protein A